MDATDLHTWLAQAHDDHAKQPQRVADALAARAATLPDDADGAEAVRLAEHVMLAHLADAPALQAFVAALPAAAALAPAVQRARWALDTVAGRPTPPLPEAQRWRALHSVVMALVAHGRADEAGARLRAEEAAALVHPDTSARQAYAATANNTALDLRLSLRGDAARDALMIEAAELARRAWAAAGTWLQVERADYQAAMCHAVLGQGGPAMAFARACLAASEAQGADAAERFFAHECLVHASRAAGDAAQAARQREQMVALLAEIEDVEMRRWCEDTLAKT